MRRRQQAPCPAGRPRLPISQYELFDLWLRGYSARGMAIHLVCDKRSVARRLAEFFPQGLSWASFSDALLYRAAMSSHDDPRPLIAFLRRQERRQRRRTGLPADERFLVEMMEYDFQQRQKLAEAQERTGVNEGSAGEDDNHG